MTVNWQFPQRVSSWFTTTKLPSLLTGDPQELPLPNVIGTLILCMAQPVGGKPKVGTEYRQTALKQPTYKQKLRQGNGGAGV